MSDNTVSWFAAVDWGSEQHQACILDAAGKTKGERAFPHGGAGLAALCDWLVSMAGDPGTVAVAIEVPHGPVVDALLDRGFAVHAINPKQLDRLRDRFSVAGAKDDRRDARVAAAGLRTDPHLFRPVQAGEPAIIELREWSRLSEELQQERVRLGNRIRQQLWRYYPQLLELADDVAAEWILALWTIAPTPAKAARLRETTLARLLKQHRIRRIDAEAALGIIRQPAIRVAAGVTEAAVLHLRSLIARLRLANREFHQAERKLGELCAALTQAEPAQDGEPSDAAILPSLPGVGQGTLATLLTEAGGPLARRDYAALRTLTGVAPVTKRSGKTCIVVMRYAAQARLRQAVFYWARIAVQHDPKAASVTRRSGRVDTPMVVPCAASPTDCSESPASCCSARPCLTPPTARTSDHNNGHPLVRLSPPSPRPDLLSAERRAQALSRRPRSGTGAVRRRAASWTARARRYARRIGTAHSTIGTAHSTSEQAGASQPFTERLTAGRKPTLAKLAVYGEIKHRAIAQPPLVVEPESNGPNLLWFQRAFSADHPARIPRSPICGRRIIF